MMNPLTAAVGLRGVVVKVAPGLNVWAAAGLTAASQTARMAAHRRRGEKSMVGRAFQGWLIVTGRSGAASRQDRRCTAGVNEKGQLAVVHMLGEWADHLP